MDFHAEATSCKVDCKGIVNLMSIHKFIVRSRNLCSIGKRWYLQKINCRTNIIIKIRQDKNIVITKLWYDSDDIMKIEPKTKQASITLIQSSSLRGKVNGTNDPWAWMIAMRNGWEWCEKWMESPNDLYVLCKLHCIVTTWIIRGHAYKYCGKYFCSF